MAGAGEEADVSGWGLRGGAPYISTPEEETVVGAGEEEEEGEEASLASGLGLGGAAGLTSVWADLVHPYIYPMMGEVSCSEAVKVDEYEAGVKTNRNLHELVELHDGLVHVLAARP
jgi:hypothetical protein